MARKTKFLYQETDVFGDVWNISEERFSEIHGITILMGHPAEHRGGLTTVLTNDLEVLLRTYWRNPGELALPIGRNAIKRLRKLLGLNYYHDVAAWWEDRVIDLAGLTTAEFSQKHRVNPGAVDLARLSLVGPRNRSRDWWKADEVRQIANDYPHLRAAELLNISAGSLRRIKWELDRFFPDWRKATKHTKRGGDTRKLTPGQAREIREKLDSKQATRAELAQKHGVSKTSVADIRAGRTYREVGGPIRSLTEQEQAEIKAALIIGATPEEVARLYGITLELARALRHDKGMTESAGLTGDKGRVPKSKKRLTDDQIRDIREAGFAGAKPQKIAKRYGISLKYTKAILAHNVRKKAGGTIVAVRRRKKLSNAQVRDAREAMAQGVEPEEIAAQYDITPAHANRLRTGRERSNAGGPITQAKRGRKRKLTNSQARKIRILIDLKEASSAELAVYYGVHPATIDSIVRGKAYRDAGGPITPPKKKKRRD